MMSLEQQSILSNQNHHIQSGNGQPNQHHQYRGQEGNSNPCYPWLACFQGCYDTHGVSIVYL